MNTEIFGYALAAFVIILALRELTAWYLKTSRIVEVLVEIRELLTEQNRMTASGLVLAEEASLQPPEPEKPKPRVYANRPNPSGE